MNARYRFDEEEAGNDDVTSITFEEDEVGELLDELNEFEVKDDSVLNQLVGHLEGLAESFDEDKDKKEQNENFCSKCGAELDD